MKHWKLQEAKNKFSQLVREAEKNGPQIVTRNDKDVVVVIPYRDYHTHYNLPDKSSISLFGFLPKPKKHLTIEEMNKIIESQGDSN